MTSLFVRTALGTIAEQGFAISQVNLNYPISPEERRFRFLGAAYAIYWQAARSRSRARSYRNFDVGCGIYAYRGGLSFPSAGLNAFYGMNSKSGKEERNICAEPVALDSAAAVGYQEVIGMVIVGETQEDDLRIVHKTLRPCKHCRQHMRNSPLVKPETLIITALPPPHEKAEWEEITHEIHTFRELCTLYGEELP